MTRPTEEEAIWGVPAIAYRLLHEGLSALSGKHCYLRLRRFKEPKLPQVLGVG